MRALWFLFIVALALLGLTALSGCAGNGSANLNNPPTGLALQPSNPSTRVNERIKFTAISPGGFGGTLQWSASAGTITQDGLFTAPSTPQTVTITASISGGPSATTTVNVTEGVVVRITPANAPVLCPGAVMKFAAIVDNAVNNGVVWSATGGTVNSEGQFVAGGVGPYTITARSVEDNDIAATISGEIVDSPRVRVSVEGRGEFVIALDRGAAPGTVTNFVNLVARNFYNGIIIHRYVEGFVVQMGDPLTKTLPLDDPAIGTGGPGYTIPFENSPLRHNKYAVAMALNAVRSDTAGSQFYIALEPQPTLDDDYCVFGNVVEGQAVVDTLRRGDRILSARTEAP